jgi:thymidylate synthase (FAD)
MQNVKVVAVSEPTIWTDAPGGPQKLTVDEFIAYVARVSNPSNQNNHLTATKLLKYLAKHKHWSPFEMVDVCMEISTTRDIGRQILRHRSFRFQEFSQRYADPTQDMGFVTREARLQDTKNRQNSIETSNEETQFEWQKLQCIVRDTSRQAYQQAIDMGIAKEQARAVLPEGLILSRMYMAGSLRSWIHYCQVRMDPSTQKEHREIAQMAWSNILYYFPSLSEVIIDS